MKFHLNSFNSVVRYEIKVLYDNHDSFVCSIKGFKINLKRCCTDDMEKGKEKNAIFLLNILAKMPEYSTSAISYQPIRLTLVL